MPMLVYTVICKFVYTQTIFYQFFRKKIVVALKRAVFVPICIVWWFSLDLLGPGDLWDVVMLGEIIQILVKLLNALLVCHRCFFHDPFLLLKIDGHRMEVY